MFDLFLFKKIHNYTLIEFIKKMLIITFALVCLIFLIDLLEFSKKLQRYNISMLIGIKIVFYRIPMLLETVFQFIILLSSIFSLTKLASNNELSVIYSSRISLWSILKQQAIFVFSLGIIMVFFINPFFIELNKKSELLELKYIENETTNYIHSEKGIWFNQSNSINENTTEDVIFRAEKVYLNNLYFKNIIIIIINNNNFYQKINAESMIFNNGKFILQNMYIIEKNKPITFEKEKSINTKITKNFLIQKIQNEYQKIDSINFKEINQMIKNFKESGLETRKFVIKQYNYLLTPFIYVLMILISGIFISHNTRINDKILNIGKTILVGLFIFICQNILIELGNSKILNIFYCLFLPIIIFYLTIINILITKIELSNV